jgi:D-aminoacyl-tRNA deacylase
MRLVIQRVSEAKVEVEGKVVGAINKGVLVFFGVHVDDTLPQTQWLANKLVNLRMFADAENKMNLSLLDIQAEALIVSQFTLYGNCSEGRRPAFTKSALPEKARKLYEKFIHEVREHKIKTQTGVFGAYMQVSLINDGPVTFILDAK